MQNPICSTKTQPFGSRGNTSLLRQKVQQSKYDETKNSVDLEHLEFYWWTTPISNFFTFCDVPATNDETQRFFDNLYSPQLYHLCVVFDRHTIRQHSIYRNTWNYPVPKLSKNRAMTQHISFTTTGISDTKYPVDTNIVIFDCVVMIAVVTPIAHVPLIVVFGTIPRLLRRLHCNWTIVLIWPLCHAGIKFLE